MERTLNTHHYGTDKDFQKLNKSALKSKATTSRVKLFIFKILAIIRFQI